jgi:Uncharacterised nucleotidyltransferase
VTKATRPENQLLRCVARTRLDPHSRHALEQLLLQPLDWNYIQQTAMNHGVAPLCYAQLQTFFPERIPEEEMEPLRAHARSVAGRNLYLAAKLVEILHRFASKDIRVIPYKGPVLAEMAYGNLGLREFVDLDFILAHRDLRPAWTVIEQLGYRPADPALAEPDAPVPGEYLFLAPGGDFHIELHTELTLRHFPNPLVPARLANSLAPVQVNGETIQTFSPEESLVFLSVHGAKDFWARLLWISDVAELIQSSQGFDWKRALAAANELGCGRFVRLAILLSNGILEAPVPQKTLDYANSDSEAKALAQMVSRWLFVEEPSGVAARARYRMGMVEGFWPGARYAWRLATTPTTEDIQAVRLPRKLGFLYPLIRPIRLLRPRSRH